MAEDKQDVLIGNGWSFPPTFVKYRGTGRLVMSDGDRDIQQSLWVLFSTSLQERIMLPGFGCGIQDMVFHAVNTTMLTQIEEMVRQSIQNWEPRIDVVRVDAQPFATAEGVVEISVDYVIRKTNSRSNLVYPFHIGEGTIPSQVP